MLTCIKYGLRMKNPALCLSGRAPCWPLRIHFVGSPVLLLVGKTTEVEVEGRNQVEEQQTEPTSLGLADRRLQVET